jgi:hypothetical protein
MNVPLLWMRRDVFYKGRASRCVALPEKSSTIGDQPTLFWRALQQVLSGVEMSNQKDCVIAEDRSRGWDAAV